MFQRAFCFSTKSKKYVGTVLVLFVIFVGTKMVLSLVFIGTKMVLFFKITLPAKHQALPGLATKVQARFPYALSHKNAHTAKKSESCFGEKTKSFFHESILVHKNFFMQLVQQIVHNFSKNDSMNASFLFCDSVSFDNRNLKKWNASFAFCKSLAQIEMAFFWISCIKKQTISNRMNNFFYVGVSLFLESISQKHLTYSKFLYSLSPKNPTFESHHVPKSVECYILRSIQHQQFTRRICPLTASLTHLKSFPYI